MQVLNYVIFVARGHFTLKHDLFYAAHFVILIFTFNRFILELYEQILRIVVSAQIKRRYFFSPL